MRKLLCILASLTLLLGLACPVLATGSRFVPSVSYKDGPQMEKAEAEGKDVTGSLVVTTILKAREKTTDIHQKDRDALLEIYEELEKGTMKLPLEGSYVIRELVDVRWRDAGESRELWLAEEGNAVSVSFDLGFTKIPDVVVLVYRNGQWEQAESEVDPTDGSVTVMLEDACPVAFCVKQDFLSEHPGTGDPAVEKLPAYLAAMAISGAALILLLILRGRKRR